MPTPLPIFPMTRSCLSLYRSRNNRLTLTGSSMKVCWLNTKKGYASHLPSVALDPMYTCLRAWPTLVGENLGQDLCPCQWSLQAVPMCVSRKDIHPFMVCLRTKELLEPIPQQGSLVITTKIPSTSEMDALQSGLNYLLFLTHTHCNVTAALPIQRQSFLPLDLGSKSDESQL